MHGNHQKKLFNRHSSTKECTHSDNKRKVRPCPPGDDGQLTLIHNLPAFLLHLPPNKHTVTTYTPHPGRLRVLLVQELLLRCRNNNLVLSSHDEYIQDVYKERDITCDDESLEILSPCPSISNEDSDLRVQDDQLTESKNR